MTSKEVANFFGGGAPAIANVASALTQKATEAKPQSQPFLRLVKGLWVYGSDNVDVEDGSQWAINPMSISTGYIAWKDSQVIGEEMAALGEPSINLHDLEQDLGKHTKGDRKGQPVEWDQQIAFSLLCIDGEDEGTEVMFKTTSHGGRKAASDIIAQVAKQASENPEEIVPIIELATDSYKHSSYGMVDTPDFVLIKFVSMDGVSVSAKDDEYDDAEVAEEVEEAPKRKRRTKKAAAAKPPAEDPEDDDTEGEDSPPSEPRRRRRRKRA